MISLKKCSVSKTEAQPDHGAVTQVFRLDFITSSFGEIYLGTSEESIAKIESQGLRQFDFHSGPKLISQNQRIVIGQRLAGYCQLRRRDPCDTDARAKIWRQPAFTVENTKGVDQEAVGDEVTCSLDFSLSEFGLIKTIAAVGVFEFNSSFPEVAPRLQLPAEDDASARRRPVLKIECSEAVLILQRRQQLPADKDAEIRAGVLGPERGSESAKNGAEEQYSPSYFHIHLSDQCAKKEVPGT